MFRYISPFYLCPSFSVYGSFEERQPIVICFAIDGVTGQVLNHALSIGKTRIDMFNVVMMGIRCPVRQAQHHKHCKSIAPSTSMFGYRLKIDNGQGVRMFMDTDYVTTSLVRRKFLKLSIDNIPWLRSLLLHHIYEWPMSVLNRINEPRSIKLKLAHEVINHAIRKFNRHMSLKRKFI